MVMTYKGGIKVAQKRYREKHRDKRNAQKRKHYRENREKIREGQRRYWKANKEKVYAYNTAWQYRARRRARGLVVKGYGGKCICCGEKILVFLEIHHPNGDGKIDRKRTGGNSLTLYNWLIKQNFPKGYELLCANCHKAKHRTKEKVCPHKTQNQ